MDAVRCAIEVQSGLAERNAGLPLEKRIEYRVGFLAVAAQESLAAERVAHNGGVAGEKRAPRLGA